MDVATLAGAYRRDGFVLVKRLLRSDEAAMYRAECHALLARLTDEADAAWESARSLDGTGAGVALRHCHDVQLYSAAFSRLLVDERFTEVAAAVVGPNVQLHHTKIFVKPPERGAPFPMHQDHPDLAHRAHTVAAAIFHFDAAPESRGCVRVVPGSHRLGPLRHESLGGGWHLPLDEWPLDRALAVPAEAGDVLFFSYLTVHGSGVNRSDEPRTTLLVQFHDPADEPVDDSNRALGRGLMLRGVSARVTARADLA
jgi:phytanoyl-CoA hydroxylase